MPTTDLPMTVGSIDGVRIVTTETGENGLIQNQLITPTTPFFAVDRSDESGECGINVRSLPE